MSRVSIKHHGELLLTEGDSVTMTAKELHTVSCPKNTSAAWFVYEGREDRSYDSVAYSNHRIDEQQYPHLYQPMDEEFLDYLLSLVF